MNSKVVIWGAGEIGEIAFYKVSQIWEIIGFCDNDNNKWDQNFLGHKIYSPQVVFGMFDCDIVIASLYYEDIYEQILENGVDAERIFYINPRSYLIQNLKGDELFYRKTDKEKLHILFVEYTPLIRIDKIACVLKKHGVHCDVAYLIAPKNFGMTMKETPYENYIPINDLGEFIRHVDNEDYDLVWSANSPDYLTTLLINTNKRIIHDTADMMSIWKDIGIDSMVHEYTANKQCHANVFVTNEIRDIAKEKFGLSNKETLILNNYVLRGGKPEKYLKKKSDIDGEIHCVYEGGIWKGKRTLRYYEDIFSQIAEKGIHVHFYSKNNEYVRSLEKLNPYLHYEGCLTYEELITELTQYDVGLVMLNITERNNKFLQTTFPNKIFEYLYAGLPVAVANIDLLIQFVEKYGVGQYLDLKGDIKKQIYEISNIKIDKDFLENNKLTMDDQAEKILSFFERVIEHTL